MKEKKRLFKMNLQFFAEPEATQESNSEPKPTQESTLSTEEQLRLALVEIEKMKHAQEKAEKEAEREEQFRKLLKENTVTKLAKNFLKLGYPEDKAEEAANAQYEGDTDTLFRIQSEVQANLIKQKEAEWYKNRPPVATGVGDATEEDAFLKGFNSVNNRMYGKK